MPPSKLPINDTNDLVAPHQDVERVKVSMRELRLWPQAVLFYNHFLYLLPNLILDAIWMVVRIEVFL
jgi:hypothetical protein